MALGLADPVSYSVRRQRLDRDLADAAALIRGRVLEIGCGRLGRRGRFQMPAGVDRLVLVDRDPARAPDVCADIVALPIASGAFDVIVCLEVLEYVWQPAAALTEIARVLKPDGTLLLSTPFMHRADAADDYWRLTEAALRRLLRESGFEVVRCVPQGGALAVAANVLRYAVSVQTSAVRRALSVLLRPFFAVLRRADRGTASRRPELATFSTGFLVVARRTAAARA